MNAARPTSSSSTAASASSTGLITSRKVFCHACGAQGPVTVAMATEGRCEPVCRVCRSAFVEELPSDPNPSAGLSGVSPSAQQGPVAPPYQRLQPQPPRQQSRPPGGGLSYLALFRRWIQEGQRARRGGERGSQEGFLNWIATFSAAAAEINSESGGDGDDDSEFTEMDDAYDYESGGRRQLLPHTCRDFTAEEILSTQVVLRHGVPSEVAARELSGPDGERAARRLDTEADARGARGVGSTTLKAEMAARDCSTSTGGDGDPVLPCCICLSELVGDASDAAVMLHCGHFFHYVCIFEWVDLFHYNCPMCRKMLIAE